MTVKTYRDAKISWTDKNGERHEIVGLTIDGEDSFKAPTECLAPPKWRGPDGRCNSCLVCSPEKFGGSQ